jgi:hypothetical protein
MRKIQETGTIRVVGCRILRYEAKTEFHLNSYMTTRTIVLFALATLSHGLCEPVDVTMSRYDRSGTGVNLSETVLNTNNVKNKFGKLFERDVDGDLYAQPLIAANVDIPGKGKRNVVYLATANNSVYAYDADDPAASSPYWHLTPAMLGDPVPRNDVLDNKVLNLNFERTIGITSTPVIDLSTRTIYVVVKSKEPAGRFAQRLHALDLSTGNERKEFNSPAIITASASGGGFGSNNGIVSFDPRKNLNRPGLLLLDGVVYLAFGSHDDDGDIHGYHGWILAYDAKTLRRIAAYCTTPDGIQGGIWQSGAALAADGNGSIYAVVGNGSLGRRDHGESILKLESGERLSIQHSFAPSNAANLNGRDLDLSGGPTVLPGVPWLLACDKQGKCYLIDRNDMHLIQEFQASINAVGAEQDPIMPNIHGTPVFWCSPCTPDQSYVGRMFVWGEEDYLREFRIGLGDFRSNKTGFVSHNQSTVHAPKSSMPGAMLTLSANGIQADTAIVWASHPSAGNANNKTVKGILRAFNAADISQQLWNSEQNPARDSLGMFAKYCPPVVANGKVYVATFAEPLADSVALRTPGKPNKLVVYGLLP